jgi:hypothetical protein
MRVRKSIRWLLTDWLKFGECWMNCSQSVRNHITLSFAHFISSTLKMKVTCFSETSVYNKPTRRHVPEDGILHSHHREKLKSWTEKGLENVHIILRYQRAQVNLTICSCHMNKLGKSRGNSSACFCYKKFTCIATLPNTHMKHILSASAISS